MLLLCLAIFLIQPLAIADDWKLVWHDEFSGDVLNPSQWGIEVNAFGGGNQELQIYTDRSKNVRVENGKLILEAHADKAEIAGTVRPYSSGRIRTKRRGDWKYGRFEIRAKLPAGQGIWPAIWMMPTDDRYGSWARSGEIAIMEFKGQNPNEIWGTLHFGDSWPDNKHTGDILKTPDVDYTKDFHVYAIEWEPTEIRWYVDGKLWQSQSKWSTPSAPFPAPFDQRFHIVLNVAVAGKFVGPVGEQTTFPAMMKVDYVRVYQKE